MSINSICPICSSPLISTFSDFLCSFNPKHYALLNNKRLFIRPIGLLPLQVVMDYSTNQTHIGQWAVEDLEDDTRAMTTLLTLSRLLSVSELDDLTQERVVGLLRE